MKTLVLFLAAVVFGAAQQLTDTEKQQLAQVAAHIPAPKLERDGYICDPDHILKPEEASEVVAILRGFGQYGVKVILCLQQSLPEEVLQAAKFEPNQAAAALVGHFATVWNEGTHRKRNRIERLWDFLRRRKPSLVIYMAVHSHGWGFSGPEEVEAKLFTKPENIRLIIQGQHDFYEKRRAARRGKLAASPEFAGLHALLSDLDTVLKSLKR